MAVGAAESSLLAVGNLASLAKAEGVESGALFRYALPKPIDLRAHGSALMPFVDAGVKVEPITYFAEPGNGGRAAAHLTNNTQQTLPAGPISVFADGGFAGESALARTKPGEERILRFGSDLDVELAEVGHLKHDEPRILRVEGDKLVTHFVRHHTITYNLDNRSGRGRRVYLALDYVENADVKGADGLEFDEETSEPLAVFSAKERTTSRRVVHVREGLSDNQPIGAMKIGELTRLSKQTSLAPEQRKLLGEAAQHFTKAERHRRSIAAIRRELGQLDRDIARLRENLRAVSQPPDELVDKLVEAEQKFGNLRRRIAKLERDRKQEKLFAKVALNRLNQAAKG
jgi:hypothetical protein